MFTSNINNKWGKRRAKTKTRHSHKQSESPKGWAELKGVTMEKLGLKINDQ